MRLTLALYEINSLVLQGKLEAGAEDGSGLAPLQQVDLGAEGQLDVVELADGHVLEKDRSRFLTDRTYRNVGNVGDAGQVGLDVEVGAVGEGLLGGDGKVRVVGAHHPAVLDGKGVRVTRLKCLFEVSVVTHQVVGHVVLGQVGVDDQAGLWGPDEGGGGDVVQLALNAEGLVSEADGGMEVSVLWGVQSGLKFLRL